MVNIAGIQNIKKNRETVSSPAKSTGLILVTFSKLKKKIFVDSVFFSVMRFAAEPEVGGFLCARQSCSGQADLFNSPIKMWTDREYVLVYICCCCTALFILGIFICVMYKR
jgi:hypothetical protein